MALTFLCLLVLTSFHLVAAHSRLSLVQQLTVKMSTCAGSGHTDGCCTDGGCSSIMGDCYCDQGCYKRGNCCPDIAVVECFDEVMSEKISLIRALLMGSMMLTNTDELESIGPSTNVPFTSESTALSATTEVTALPTTTEVTATFAPGTCQSLGFTDGCCVGDDATTCGVTYNRNTCFCSRDCYEYDDCCNDISEIGCTELPTTPPPNPSPTSCIELRDGKSGCCNGSSACTVVVDNEICYCNYKNEPYCEDIGAINCYPQSCQEAGHDGCCDPKIKNCEVKTGPNTSCYCNARCGTENDCCPGFNSSQCPPDTTLLSQLLQMRILAQLMSNIPSQDWGDLGAANLKRRYQAGLVALMQQYLREVPK